MPVIRNAPPKFDESVPVVVVGGGACGMTAGLAAADAGADVLVLERDAKPFGSTGMSQGFICAAGTRLQRDAGIEDAPEIMLADIMAKTRGQTDPALARTIAYESGPTIDFLTETHGLPLRVDSDWRGDFGHTRRRMHGTPHSDGEELLTLIRGAAEARGAMVMTGARVSDVYADDSGRVLGVGVDRPDGRRETIGCEALVLATCGFGGNHAMVRQFIPEMADSPYHGHEGNKGDGILWGMELGAATGDMGAFQGYGALAEPHGVLFNYNIIMEGGIQVNRLGERFSNELADISGQGPKVCAQPENTAFAVYDDRLHAWGSHLREYKQLIELGAIRSAPDAESLAALLRVPAEALARTLHDVAEMAAGRMADPWGRDFTKHQPLQAPYRAVRVKGALFHTQGGLEIDGQARVRRADGGLLPNLYAGGGAARSISGPGVWGYLPAAGLCMAVTLGRLAGQAAARQVVRRASAAEGAGSGGRRAWAAVFRR